MQMMSTGDPKAAARLRDARAMAGYESAADAARALAVGYSTYVSHENGTRGFKKAAAFKYAKSFKVDPNWLQFGIGNPRGPDLLDKIKSLNEDNQKHVFKTVDALLAQERADRERSRR